jgi:hypothetical protein
MWLNVSLVCVFASVDSVDKRDTFDYTEWRRGLWNDMTIEEIYTEAAEHSEHLKSNMSSG